MKAKLAIAVLLSASTFSLYAADSAIKVTGQVIDFGCSVSTESADFTVDLMKNSAKQFTSVGNTTPNVPFKIILTDCSDSTTGVKVLFSGNADDNNNTLLKLDEISSGAAGMAVEILDGQGQQLPINSANANLNWIKIQSNKDNILPFSARLKTTYIPIRSGLVNATATFTLEFQ